MCIAKEGKKEKIASLVKENPRGLTITEIAKKSELSRHTVSVALAELKGEGKIDIREVSKAKLHYWRVKNDRV